MLEDADALFAKLPRDAQEAFVRADAANERMRAGDQRGYAESLKQAGLAHEELGHLFRDGCPEKMRADDARGIEGGRRGATAE